MSMEKDPKRMDVVLSLYKKTTDIFSEFGRSRIIEINPFRVKYVYDTLYLKDFMNISLKLNGKTSNYKIGFLVEHCDYWNEESQKKRRKIKKGIIMSELKKDFYKKFFHASIEGSILEDIFSAISKYLDEGGEVNESIIPFAGFELYAQDSYSRNHPGSGIEYGETDTYLVCEMVVDKCGLVWDE